MIDKFEIGDLSEIKDSPQVGMSNNSQVEEIVENIENKEIEIEINDLNQQREILILKLREIDRRMEKCRQKQQCAKGRYL